MTRIGNSDTPACEGGSAVRDDFLPFSLPYIGEEEKEAVVATLESGWLSTGPRTKDFERRMASYLGAKHALALSSCTAGLHLALVAKRIGPGDEVITSPFTFPSTLNVIVQTGARPVLADIDPRTFNIDPRNIELMISARTKAIIPVHYGGQPCAMTEILGIARENSDILVIEDAATAVGAKYRGAFIGAIPETVAIFSFYANKVMTTGEGGMLLTGNGELAEKAGILSLHGMNRDAWKRYSDKSSWYFEITEPGFKYNMMDIQAALGLCQLDRLESLIERRESICRRYDEAFGGTGGIITPTVQPHVRSARYLYPILVDENVLRIKRDHFVGALKAENVGSSVHYIPAHLHPYYRDALGLDRGSFPIAEHVFDRLVSLPLFPGMKDQDVNDVITAVSRLARYYKK